MDYDPIEGLLLAAQSELKNGEPERAKQIFEQVLKERPGHARAELGIATAERAIGEERLPSVRPPSMNPDDVRVGHTEVDQQIVALVKSRQYESALTLLQKSLLSRPTDTTIRKSIEHLEKRLERRYRKRLGDLDRTPSANEGSAAQFGDEAAAMLARVNGERSLSALVDTAERAFDGLRSLARLSQAGLITIPNIEPAMTDEISCKVPAAVAPEVEAPARTNARVEAEKARLEEPESSSGMMLVALGVFAVAAAAAAFFLLG